VYNNFGGCRDVYVCSFISSVDVDKFRPGKNTFESTQKPAYQTRLKGFLNILFGVLEAKTVFSRFRLSTKNLLGAGLFFNRRFHAGRDTRQKVGGSQLSARDGEISLYFPPIWSHPRQSSAIPPDPATGRLLVASTALSPGPRAATMPPKKFILPRSNDGPDLPPPKKPR
jgi:hypothetical protein